MTNTDTDLDWSAINNLAWYYRVELEKGRYSPGAEHKTLVTTRDLLRKLDPAGLRCLDIGTMEGVVSTLLARRGGLVTAYDRDPREAQINAVKQAYGVDFIYKAGKSLNDFTADMVSTEDPFDVVVFSGVLYHLMGPLDGLARVRGLVRNGGLMFVETPAMIARGDNWYFNTNGQYYPDPATYFIPTIDALARALEFVNLDILDFRFIPVGRGTNTEEVFVRIALVCRATDRSPNNDAWFQDRDNLRAADWADVIDWQRVQSQKDEIAYPRTIAHARQLYAALVGGPALSFSDDDVCLSLDDAT